MFRKLSTYTMYYIESTVGFFPTVMIYEVIFSMTAFVFSYFAENLE